MNSEDIAAARVGVLPALRKAHAVVGVGDVNGWPRPKAYTDALAMLNAARAARDERPALPPPPDKVKDIRRWIDTTVEIRQQEDLRLSVADELLLIWERNTAEAGLSVVADYTARLITVFDELVAKLDAHTDSPRALTGHETDREIESYTAALRAAGDLSKTVMQRALIADAAGEGEFIGVDIIWLVLAPHSGTTRDDIQNALQTFKSRIPQTLDEWESVRPLGVRLAELGEVADRRDRHAQFIHNVGMRTRDLGMKNHAYGEFEDDLPTPQYGHQMQANADAIFEQSPSMTLP